MKPQALHALVACSLALAAWPARAMAPDELFRQVSPSVWQVATSDADGKPIGTGSAVVIGSETLVTNCHVLKGAATVIVRQHNTLHGARLKHADTERDLCLMTVAGLEAPAVRIAPELAHVGQRIYTIGAPRGLELTLSDGLVSGLREEGGSGGLIQISAPISPGSSGGGLFDEDGRLLGITSSGVVGVAQNLNFARPASLIAEIPTRAGAALQRWREAKGGSPPAPPVATAAVPPSRTGGFAPLQDAEAVPYLPTSGRDEYRRWLGLSRPRAFAISPTGQWAGVNGTHPNYVAPSDPSARALQVCEQRAHGPCRLYAVDDAVVWTGETAAPPVARAPAPAESAPPAAPAPASPQTSGPGHLASGYAAIDDIDAIPYLTARGRKGYQEWLGLPLPRAFALAPNGYYWFTSTTRPREADLPVDPGERALLMCERSAKRPCKLYAVNNAVVWVKEPSPLAGELEAGTSPPPKTTQP